MACGHHASSFSSRWVVLENKNVPFSFFTLVIVITFIMHHSFTFTFMLRTILTCKPIRQVFLSHLYVFLAIIEICRFLSSQ